MGAQRVERCRPSLVRPFLASVAVVAEHVEPILITDAVGVGSCPLEQATRAERYRPVCVRGVGPRGGVHRPMSNLLRQVGLRRRRPPPLPPPPSLSSPFGVALLGLLIFLVVLRSSPPQGGAVLFSPFWVVLLPLILLVGLTGSTTTRSREGSRNTQKGTRGRGSPPKMKQGKTAPEEAEGPPLDFLLHCTLLHFTVLYFFFFDNLFVTSFFFLKKSLLFLFFGKMSLYTFSFFL